MVKMHSVLFEHCCIPAVILWCSQVYYHSEVLVRRSTQRLQSPVKFWSCRVSMTRNVSSVSRRLTSCVRTLSLHRRR